MASGRVKITDPPVTNEPDHAQTVVELLTLGAVMANFSTAILQSHFCSIPEKYAAPLNKAIDDWRAYVVELGKD